MYLDCSCNVPLRQEYMICKTRPSTSFEKVEYRHARLDLASLVVKPYSLHHSAQRKSAILHTAGEQKHRNASTATGCQIKSGMTGLRV